MRTIVTLTFVLAAFAAGASHAASDRKPADAQPAQHSRMKDCSAGAKAKGLKGDERKAFMSDCLKKKD
ncbi:PsiF family protein [Ramlibacter algicola]|uniref:PsiF repeat-containing protein n=1 Tax=Ramlibacter algicola TaxID=2795217 RepID=A0A934PYP4_9BURK|nr:PsiF family protein [Ramlibacter algicola]MBK0391548.1 hypothetical protein [Ramlibacter algicola]